MLQVGAVNFNALHSLLHALVSHLGLGDITVHVVSPEPAQEPEQDGGTGSAADSGVEGTTSTGLCRAMLFKP